MRTFSRTATEARTARTSAPSLASALLATLTLAFFVALATASVAHAWTPLPVKADRNVFMPGSQQDSVILESQGRCDNCHGGYDQAVEPAYNQYGSMMAQAARDPLWLACLTVSAQDSIWAVGNPNATDICIRCHTPPGWLGGRSDPTNTSALTSGDYEGISCDFCHTMVDPLAQLGQPEVAAETVPAGQTAAAATKTRDLTVLGALKLFDGTTPFLNGTSKLPTHYGDGSWPNYVESTAGQYFIDTGNSKSGPFYDTVARHGVYYSRFHKSKRFCGTCHDVSNPVLANVTSPGMQERQAGGSYFHVERTYSEFSLSAYAQPGGAVSTMPGITAAAKCQDCHMRDVTGKGCNKADAPLRTDMPLHDHTGGNAWMTGILASAVLGEPQFDAYNHAILSGTKYPGAKIDVTGLQAQGPQLLAGKQRALQNLQQAATVQTVSETADTLTVRVRNNTGHKLISGFPEGRRMFLYVTFYDAAGKMVGEVNPYEVLFVEKDAQGNEQHLAGGDLAAPSGELQSADEHLVWGAHMSSSLTGEQESYHFALATSRYKDNRIPPKGFDTTKMAERIVQPVWHGAEDPGYFTSAEYAGGYDELALAKPAGATQWYATLYYQSTSKEYVEFLRDEIEGTGGTLSSPTPSGEANAYVAQTDPFFTGLKGWGDAIWDLWLHNGGAAPIKMTEAGTAARQGMMTSVGDVSVWRFRKRSGGDLLSWAAVPGATAYRVERNDGGTWTLVGTTADLSLRVPVAAATYGVSAVKVLPDSTVVAGPRSEVTTGI